MFTSFLTSWYSVITVSLMIQISFFLKFVDDIGANKVCTHKCFFFINRKLLSVDALEIHCFLNYKLQTKIWHAVGNSYVNFDSSLLMITVNGLEILIFGKRLIKEKWAVSFSIACLQTLQTLSLQAKGLCIALRDAYFLFNSLT